MFIFFSKINNFLKKWSNAHFLSLSFLFFEKGSLEFFSDKQLEYLQYNDILSDNEIHYPRHTLLWEYGEEIAKIADHSKNHSIILLTSETYRYAYIDNKDMIYFICG